MKTMSYTWRLNKILFSVLVAGSVAFSSHAQTLYPIVWTDLVNISVNADNSLKKTTTASAWDAGATGQNTLAAGQDGYIEFTYTPITGAAYMFALSRLNKSVDYKDNDYSLYVNGSTLRIFNLQSQVGSNIALTAGDVLRLSREGSLMKYYRNGGLITQSTIPATTDVLRVEAVMYAGMSTTVPVMASFRPMLVVKPLIVHPGRANNDGSITAQVEGQSGNVSYLWSTGETSASITGKPRGTYTVTVTDGLGRSVQKTYTLAYPLSWTNVSNISIASDNTLFKTDPQQIWNAGASSLNVLPANQDGFIEFVINDAGGNFMISLSRVDYSLDYPELVAAWYATRIGALYIYESGTSRGIMNSFTKGDVFRIAREQGFIRYYLNGQKKREIAASSTVPVIVDVVVSETRDNFPVIGASFDKAIRVMPSITLPNSDNKGGSIALSVQGTYPPATIKWSSDEASNDLSKVTSNLITNQPRAAYSVMITDDAGRAVPRTYHLGYPIIWTDMQGVTLNDDNSMTELLGSGDVSVWTAGALSSNNLPAATNGWMEFIMKETNSREIIGLAQLNNSVAISSVTYGFYFEGANVNIYEAGTSRAIGASRMPGDVYTIERKNGSIIYYINGVAVRTLANVNMSLVLYADVSIDYGVVPVVTTSFTRAPQTFYSIANGPWTTAATWSLADGGIPATIYPGPQDIVYIKGNAVNVTTAVSSNTVNITATNGTTSLVLDGSQASLTVKGKVVLQGDNNEETARALIVQNGARIAVVP